ncbi:hypothetical protein FQB35_12645 [Crassaminicella thermophila]|uniref:SLH domain-containing protein n=1 Tax=Crassaminicella thermophila TaxID=2599308 RepID=A0A5C0SJH6_CRATE|nr:S-layer homology domain-containing protein [Crassaminicella thermophila]QEK13099.1 hypothetical protein FQB35_12645 [Crassaminicella thermophila]
MKNKVKYIFLMLLFIIISSVYTIAYADNVIGYFPPQPKDVTVLVSKPSISMQLVLNNNVVKEIDMKLNGNKVAAEYDQRFQTISYKPVNPLKPGQYKVDLNIVLEDQKMIKESWQFIVSENAVDELSKPTEEQKKVINYANRYRRFLGLKEFSLNDSLNAAAMGHSNYMAINKKLIHQEFSNDKGFTGTESYSRAGAFGYVGSYMSENVSFGQKDYKEAIDALMDAPYHRLVWINPFFVDLGYGEKEKYYTFTFGGKKTLEDKLVVYPIKDQEDVPTSWDGNEIPNPLRFYTKKDMVGYPISLSYFSKKNIKKFILEKATLKNSKGSIVDTYINTPTKDEKLQESILIIPSNPLAKGEKYTVSVKGSILFDDQTTVEINKTWNFTTVVEENDKNGWMKKFIYDDIKDHWAQKDILYLGEKGIVSPKQNNLYKPNDKITRAEFAEFVVNVLGLQTKPYEGIFKDVKENTNKAVYIEAAFREGIVKGLGDGNFQPNRTIKREEIAALVMRAYEKKGNLHKIKQLPLLSFVDQKDISSWALKDVKGAYELGIIKGRDTGEFAPKDFATRAEAAVMIMRLLEKL